MKFVTNVAAVALAASVSLYGQMGGSKDQKFAKSAAQGGMAEVQLGEVALKNADSSKVKEFAQKMVDDHGKANDKLKSVAGQKNMTLPSSLNAKDQALLTRLSALHGAAFDKAYMTAMVKDHQMDVSEFQKEASGGQDSDLKMFASDTLPTLKGHLDMAKETSGTVGR